MYYSRIEDLSGGEHKRFSIASELLLGRGLIALDEPTTGVSAKESLSIARVLKSLSDEKISVIASIHQPRSDILKYFDLLLVLSKGRMVFFGKREDAVQFFSQCKQSHQEEIENQADFICNSILLYFV